MRSNSPVRPLSPRSSSQRRPVNESRIEQLAQHFKARLLRETDLEKLTRMSSSELRVTLDRLIGRYLAEEQVVLPRHERDMLIGRIIDESVGYGPLEPLLEDEEITEIMVNGPNEVRSEEHTSELQSRENLVCRLLL